MKRFSILSIAVIALAAIAIGVGLALPSQGAEAQGRPEFSLPPQAQEVAPGVFLLGNAVVNGRVATGYAIAHHREGHGGGPGNGGGGNGGGGNGGGGDDPAAGCFSFLGRGAKWTAAEPFVFNGANSDGLAQNTLLGLLGTSSLEQWDGQVTAEIFSGGALTTATLEADTDEPDDLNEVYFATITNPGTIAFTIVWGFFIGPPQTRELIEWDMVFDDDGDYHWSLAGEAGKMDFWNIAAHEAGHAAGMGHTDTSDTCLQQTMYPTAGFGETIKRSLEAGDIAGIVKLYG